MNNYHADKPKCLPEPFQEEPDRTGKEAEENKEKPAPKPEIKGTSAQRYERHFKPQKQSKKRILIIVLAVLVMVAALAAELSVLYFRQKQAAEDREAFDRVTAEFDTEFPVFLEKQYADFPLAKKVEATAESIVKPGEETGRLGWEENIAVTVFAEDEFNGLSYDEISSYLKDVKHIADSAHLTYDERMIIQIRLVFYKYKIPTFASKNGESW